MSDAGTWCIEVCSRTETVQEPQLISQLKDPLSFKRYFNICCAESCSHKEMILILPPAKCCGWLGTWSSDHHECQHNSRSLWWWQAWWERSCLSSPHGIELICLNEAGVSVLGVGRVFESSELEEPLARGFQHHAAQLGLALSVLGKSHPLF